MHINMIQMKMCQKKDVEGLLGKHGGGRNTSSSGWREWGRNQNQRRRQHSSRVLKELGRFVPKVGSGVIPRTAGGEQRQGGWEMSYMFDVVEGRRLGR